MKYYVLVKPEAVSQFNQWLAEPDKKPDVWLINRVRVVTQNKGGWCCILLTSDAFQLILDNFDELIINSYE